MTESESVQATRALKRGNTPRSNNVAETAQTTKTPVTAAALSTPRRTDQRRDVAEGEKTSGLPRLSRPKKASAWGR
jgi:hypothetical protein